MLFNSLSYAIFFPVVFILYWRLPQKLRWLLLLISSYYFYMSWNPKYVVLILGTTFVSYMAAILMERYPSMKKIFVIWAAVLCFGMLFVFKYFTFFQETLFNILSVFGVNSSITTFNILLPVGISFYTFQTFSYVIDVYKGEVPAERHFGYYATFISFFPQLVAGPIERSANLLPQIKSQKVFKESQAVEGMVQMLLGFFKKMVIADTMAIYVDRVYSSLRSFTGFSLAAVCFFFAIQIYCDFSGYSDIAIGSAKLLGINLMENFRSPYFSSSIKEFWARWHISLSTWFRDYIYIPLGGNRVSPLRHKINILITFLVSGLWHGANWTYVAWGAVHGIGQIVEGVLLKRPIKNKLWKVCCTMATFAFCCFAWVLFRAESFGDALFVYANMFSGITHFTSYIRDGFRGLEISKLTLLQIVPPLLIAIALDFVAARENIVEKIQKQRKTIRWGIYIIIGLCIVFFTPIKNESEFIYFQF